MAKIVYHPYHREAHRPSLGGFEPVLLTFRYLVLSWFIVVMYPSSTQISLHQWWPMPIECWVCMSLESSATIPTAFTHQPGHFPKKGADHYRTRKQHRWSRLDSNQELDDLNIDLLVWGIVVIGRTNISTRFGVSFKAVLHEGLEPTTIGS
jgi:hypothetical protein